MDDRNVKRSILVSQIFGVLSRAIRAQARDGEAGNRDLTHHRFVKRAATNDQNTV